MRIGERTLHAKEAFCSVTQDEERQRCGASAAAGGAPLHILQITVDEGATVCIREGDTLPFGNLTVQLAELDAGQVTASDGSQPHTLSKVVLSVARGGRSTTMEVLAYLLPAVGLGLLVNLATATRYRDVRAPEPSSSSSAG